MTLIHPGLWDRRTWDREFRTFAEAGYRVVRYDVRGYGKSSRLEPGATYSHVPISTHCSTCGGDPDRAGRVLDGGGIAIDYALEYPAKVWALVPVATALGWLRSHRGRGGMVGAA